MKTIVSLVFLLFSFTMIAQKDSCARVMFSGNVQDTLRPQSFYNLMVINKTAGRGVFGQPDGTFSVYCNDGDSLVLSVKNYPLIGIRINADSNCQFKGTFYLEPQTLHLDEVIVKPLKTLEEIKEERASLALRETRMVTGIDVMQSPITALYQAFSKKERSKRWVAEQELNDDKMEVLKELLRLYVAYDIIELSDEEFEEFIIFLNPDLAFLQTATEMELITFVQDKFEHFKMLKGKLE